MKTCSSCKTSKPVSEFRASKTKDGLYCYCKPCAAAYRKQHYWDNREKYIAEAADWEKQNPDRRKARSANYYTANKEKIKAVSAARYKANAKELIAQSAAYHRANPGIAKAASAKCRAKRIAAPGSHTKHDIAALMKLQRGLCVACRCDIRQAFHVDHIVALARGGSNDKTNLQLLCATCNRSKNAKHPIDFMQSKGFLL